MTDEEDHDLALEFGEQLDLAHDREEELRRQMADLALARHLAEAEANRLRTAVAYYAESGNCDGGERARAALTPEPVSIVVSGYPVFFVPEPLRVGR